MLLQTIPSTQCEHTFKMLLGFHVFQWSFMFLNKYKDQNGLAKNKKQTMDEVQEYVDF